MGFDIGGALSGAIGGFAVGGPWGAAAGGLGGGLLGGGDPGGVTTGTVNKWQPWQQDLTKDLHSYLKTPTGDAPSWQPPGFFQPSLKALEEWSLQPPYQIDQEKFGTGQQAMIDAIGRGPQDINELFTRTVSDPLTQQFRDEIMPALRLRSGEQMYSTTSQSAEERATQDLVDALARGRSEYSFAARESDLNRALIAGKDLTGSEIALADAMRTMKQGNLEEILRLYQLGRGELYTPEEQREQQRMSMIMRSLGLSGVEPYAAYQPPGTDPFAELAAAYLSTESGAGALKEQAGKLDLSSLKKIFGG